MQLGEEPREGEYPEEENPRTKKQSPVRWLAVCGCLGFAGVVAVGLIATLVVPQAVERLTAAREGVAKSDIAAISMAVDQYRINNGANYPLSLEELTTPDASGERYLEVEFPVLDPWGNEYVYEPGTGTTPALIWTLGSDGKRGGEGEDRDFNNEMIRNGDV